MFLLQSLNSTSFPPSCFCRFFHRRKENFWCNAIGGCDIRCWSSGSHCCKNSCSFSRLMIRLVPWGDPSIVLPHCGKANIRPREFCPPRLKCVHGHSNCGSTTEQSNNDNQSPKVNSDRRHCEWSVGPEQRFANLRCVYILYLNLKTLWESFFRTAKKTLL